MVKSTVYLEAAQKVGEERDRHWYSCNAIRSVQRDRGELPKYGDHAPTAKEFAYSELFRPRELSECDARYANCNPPECHDAWGQFWGEGQHECRILALLFMHWIEVDNATSKRS
jgi:hypothetical protein